MHTFRLFVSSPGDAAIERSRTENVVSRLNGEFSGLARLVTVRWETSFYRADSTFQSQIPAAAECDIVVGILKWRLGTELPDNFPQRMPDGSAYPSGTAYEILSAIERRRSTGTLPDVFVFRFKSGSPRPELDDPQRDRIERDWLALRRFFERWFVTAQGHFIAALNGYGSEDQFEHQLERLLRRWLADKVSGGRVVPWPESKGTPFRGLGVFGALHAPVFFGRATDTRRTVDLLRERAVFDGRFLLLVGASGAGKSSLARAGVIPRLTTPGVIANVDFWRIAVMRPGDSVDGPPAALAAALFQSEDELPAEEKGRGSALPEIAEGDSKGPAQLAAVLAAANESAVRPIVNALERIGERWRRSEHFERRVRCDLVLLIDQLDELFAPSVTSPQRAAFSDLMAALVESGRIWVIATLRADFYAQMLEMPALKKLKEIGATYDLAPPGAAELAEIVREPARAAGLTFEVDRTTDEFLDERLLREADKPDMLPLVQLVLSRLWEMRESRGGETVLTIAAFEKLGGVEGIVAQAGDQALGALGEIGTARLGRLVRTLAEAPRLGAAVNVRAVPVADAAPAGDARRLVDALVAVRLLTLANSGGVDLVRLTHQRVLSDWPAAAAIVAESADFYRVRDDVEGRQVRWVESKRRSEFLLPRGLPLAEANAMVAKYRTELAATTLSYVAASNRRANRVLMIAWGAAAAFALVAAGAVVATLVAVQQSNQAQRNYLTAGTLLDNLVVKIAEGNINNAAMKSSNLHSILEAAEAAIAELVKISNSDMVLKRRQVRVLYDFAEAYLYSGDTRSGLGKARRSVAMARSLAATSRDAASQAELVFSLLVLGDATLRWGDHQAALAAYQEALAKRRELLRAAPDSQARQRGVLYALNKVGDALVERGDLIGARAVSEESLKIAREPLKGAKFDLLFSLNKISVVWLAAGRVNEALAATEESLRLARDWVLHPGATDTVGTRRTLAWTLQRRGEAMLRSNDARGALAAYVESLALKRSVAPPETASGHARRDVSIALREVGDAKGSLKDLPGAAAAYTESLRIVRELAPGDPDNAELSWDLVRSLMAQAPFSPAPADLYREALTICRTLDSAGRLAPSRKSTIDVLETRLRTPTIADVK